MINMLVTITLFTKNGDVFAPCSVTSQKFSFSTSQEADAAEMRIRAAHNASFFSVAITTFDAN